MLLLGIDLGTSSIKVSVVDAASRKTLVSVSYPETEREIKSLQRGWAEQYPLQWFQDTKQAILKANSTGAYNPQEIAAIGIAYQMHGLVMVDEAGHALRDSIIWCDSRAVQYGEAANTAIGPEHCLKHLLNSPGNFTAAKLAWVKEHEPDVYARMHRLMLPGDYLALQLTGDSTSTVSMLSEGIFWDFQANGLSADVLNYFGFDEKTIPPTVSLFGNHGALRAAVAAELGLRPGVPVTYKAGDQPNNALSLGVLKPGEVATTAGTSGVIYAVTDQLFYDPQSRVNTFAHVNHTAADPRLGVLLCINGAGIANRWQRQNFAPELSYGEIDRRAGGVTAGADGLLFLPFGNGAERMLGNRQVGAQLIGLDLNKHSTAHVFRAVHEGIAFAHRYGLDIMRENGLQPRIAKAGYANMFLNDTFTTAFVESTGLAVELYRTEGSVGAAFGAGIGAGIFAGEDEAVAGLEHLRTIEPGASVEGYEDHYQRWKEQLDRCLVNS
jgi:xylulokinase